MWWRLSVSLLRVPLCNPSLRLFSSLLPPPPPMGSKSKAPPESGPEHPKDEAYLNTVISKRIALFESIKSEQLARPQSLSGDLIKITLPDGSLKEGKKWILTLLDIAKEISKSLAANALISKVNGVLWDMSRPLEGDCDLQGFYYDAFYGNWA
ncbi:threonine--tRNA ligase, mitochondrial 1-like [Actinidia eriantha]|uniref:threonine--tRNA ligase, mitochondrial 1-like n=1 Tax=Actinidia eriantha TaxID=165200 RepID=UPI00258F368B|nr:threonine--tRNA ligase, mitochondrial 1-like [Actinidia eriantha]